MASSKHAPVSLDIPTIHKSSVACVKAARDIWRVTTLNKDKPASPNALLMPLERLWKAFPVVRALLGHGPNSVPEFTQTWTIASPWFGGQPIKEAHGFTAVLASSVLHECDMADYVVTGKTRSGYFTFETQTNKPLEVAFAELMDTEQAKQSRDTVRETFAKFRHVLGLKLESVFQNVAEEDFSKLEDALEHEYEHYTTTVRNDLSSKKDEQESGKTKTHTNPNVSQALAIIRAEKGGGLSGKEIVKKLAKKGITIDEKTLRRHVVPELKLRGIKNERARGGYYDPTACRNGM